MPANETSIGRDPRPTENPLPAEATAGPRIWFDLTTSIQLSGLPPVGISRVEGRYAGDLARRLPGRVGFCRFDPAMGRYRPVEPKAAQSAIHLERRVESPGRPKRRGPIRQAGREFERWFRQGRRRLLRGVFRVLPGLAAALISTIPFRRGDLLILGGATWEKHDLAQLRRLTREVGVSLVCICYDLVPVKFPEFHIPESVANFQRFMEFVVREAALVLCISEATRRDLEAFAADHGCHPRDARVVALGHSLAPPSPEPPLGLPPSVVPGSYVLYVSTIQVRKNHRLLYQLWRRMAERGESLPHLLFVGVVGWLVEDLLAQIERDELLRDRIVILSRTTDAELSWLYGNALFTVYPSFYEGWGLPISESLMHGKACIASNSASMPEAGQGLAIHLDPLDLPGWHREVRALIDDSARREALEAEIRARYRPLDWTSAGASFAREIAAFLEPQSRETAAAG